jgi:hypothetical protein
VCIGGRLLTGSGGSNVEGASSNLGAAREALISIQDEAIVRAQLPYLRSLAASSETTKGNYPRTVEVSCTMLARWATTAGATRAQPREKSSATAVRRTNGDGCRNRRARPRGG